MASALPLVGLGFVLSGAYLVDSSLKNRSPLGTIRALIDDPKDAMGTIERLNGTWYGKPEQFGPGAIATVLEGSGSTGAYSDKGSNGRLPASALQQLSWAPGHRLIPPAANALEQLNKAYKARFGVNIKVTDSYRTYASQVRLKLTKGSFAATPGKSVHGWGRAVDLGGGINNWGTPQRDWFVKNAPKFGWNSPAWAQKGQKTPEPWHWEWGS
jgi:hypothetical protein